MRRIVSLFCILMSLVMLLTSCHGVKQTEDHHIDELPEFDTSREYELTFWAKNDTNITQANIYKQAIADFEKLYPNIHVTIKPYTDYSRIYADVITNIQTGTTPNICITYPDHIATYNSGEELVADLDAFINDTRYGLGGSELKFDGVIKQEIVPEFLSECYLNGKPYALPFMRSTEACYVNKTYVEKLGFTLPETLTWDFVWQVSEAATKKNDDGTFVVNGKDTLIPFIYKSTDNMMIQMLKQKGAEYSDELGNINVFNEETKEILKTISPHAKTKAFSTFKISSYPANYLNAGECIFAIDSTAGATWMGADAPNVDIAEESMVDFEIEVMTIPQYDVENPVMISQGPSVCIFNKEDPQEVLASWLFVQYLLSNDVQIAYSQTEGYSPVTTKAQNSEEYKDYLSRAGEDNDLYYDVKLKATKLLMENTENTFVTPVFNGSASLRNAAGQMIEEVTKRGRRNKPVDDDYIENELYSQMISQYKLDMSVKEGDTASVPQKAELGPMPTESIILLSTLLGVWIILGILFVREQLKKSKKLKN